jgi:hypothetical protein
LLTLEYTGQHYSTGEQYIETVESFRHVELELFEETVVTPANTEVRYILKRDDDWYWWNGSAWAISDETFAESNPASVIEANKATFSFDDGVNTFVRIFLSTTDDQVTPEIQLLFIEYHFHGVDDVIEKTLVFGHFKLVTGDPSIESIVIFANKEALIYKTNTIIRSERFEVVPSDVDGYWEIELVETDNMEEGAGYMFQFGKDRHEVTVPNTDTIAFRDLPTI